MTDSRSPFSFKTYMSIPVSLRYKIVDEANVIRNVIHFKHLVFLHSSLLLNDYSICLVGTILRFALGAQIPPLLTPYFGFFFLILAPAEP